MADRSAGPVGGRGRRAFRNQLGIIAGVLPAIAFVLVVDRAEFGVAGAVGIGVLLAALVVTAWVRELDRRWFAAVLAADLVGIAVIRADVPSVGITVLLVLPALWAGYAFRWRGAVLVTIASTATLWLGSPDEWAVIDRLDTARLVILPLVIGAVSGTAAAFALRQDARALLLRRQTEFVERTLREVSGRERLVSAVLDAVDFDIVAFDDDRNITVSNGQRRSGVLDDLGHATDGHPGGVLDRVFAGAELDGELLTVRRGDGTTRTYTVTARQFVTDGEPGGVIVARDVTAEREAIGARDDLIASVSHELRTPVTAILGSIELARDAEGLDPDTERLLEVASRNAERLVVLVNGILQSAREERVDLVLAPCDLVDVARAAVESAEPVALAADVRLTLSPTAPATVETVADAFRIRQVLDNLISNAVKYNRPGGTVEIGLAAHGDRVWLTVRDDGIGIADADQDRLFERFFRAEAVRSSGVHGTGLGLAICREIVRRHRGDLTITSELGDGTTATVVLPRDAGATTEERP
ncbi:hypothetical protein Csp2054_10125 [Curtobacterium sp. 'Ferrero']|uniref:sensor histidine kinase n=1 Tax=Curtobacterium sp. 'Ferrero' TaxID=2033654 RepID=UPI000BD2DD11|nr:HAMP domain-containing sensor histidine kinase [Curtobacterium sp. 'Ferrero']PCN47722.1 hypothetical protein Csp2054_10125 [Curtobacterium sp. 'Ferrero']